VFCERMLIVRCANGGVAWLLSVRSRNGHGNVQSGRYAVVPPSRSRPNMGDRNRSDRLPQRCSEGQSLKRIYIPADF